MRYVVQAVIDGSLMIAGLLLFFVAPLAAIFVLLIVLLFMIGGRK